MKNKIKLLVITIFIISNIYCGSDKKEAEVKNIQSQDLNSLGEFQESFNKLDTLFKKGNSSLYFLGNTDEIRSVIWFYNSLNSISQSFSVLLNDIDTAKLNELQTNLTSIYNKIEQLQPSVIFLEIVTEIKRVLGKYSLFIQSVNSSMNIDESDRKPFFDKLKKQNDELKNDIIKLNSSIKDLMSLALSEIDDSRQTIKINNITYQKINIIKCNEIVEQIKNKSGTSQNIYFSLQEPSLTYYDNQRKAILVHWLEIPYSAKKIPSSKITTEEKENVYTIVSSFYCEKIPYIVNEDASGFKVDLCLPTENPAVIQQKKNSLRLFVAMTTTPKLTGDLKKIIVKNVILQLRDKFTDEIVYEITGDNFKINEDTITDLQWGTSDKGFKIKYFKSFDPNEGSLTDEISETEIQQTFKDQLQGGNNTFWKAFFDEKANKLSVVENYLRGKVIYKVTYQKEGRIDYDYQQGTLPVEKYYKNGTEVSKEEFSGTSTDNKNTKNALTGSNTLSGSNSSSENQEELIDLDNEVKKQKDKLGKGNKLDDKEATNKSREKGDNKKRNEKRSANFYDSEDLSSNDSVQTGFTKLKQTSECYDKAKNKIGIIKQGTNIDIVEQKDGLGGFQLLFYTKAENVRNGKINADGAAILDRPNGKVIGKLNPNVPILIQFEDDGWVYANVDGFISTK